MIRYLTILIVFQYFALVIVCIASELPQVFETTNGLTIYLPDDWMAIPKDVLEEYSENVRLSEPNAEKHAYAYGYQKSSADNWLEYPYILIQIMPGIRIRESDMMSASSVIKTNRESVDIVVGSVTSTLSLMQGGESVYDSQRKILWAKLHAKVSGIGDVSMLSGLLQAKTAVIMIFAYSKTDELPVYLPLFEKIISNAEISSEYEYVSEKNDGVKYIKYNIDVSNIIGAFFTTALLFFIMSLFGSKKKHSEVPERVEMTCPNCGTKYYPSDYNPDIQEWKCSTCKHPIPKA